VIENFLLGIINFSSGKYSQNLITRSKERLRILDYNSCKTNINFLTNFYSTKILLGHSYSHNNFLKEELKISKKQLIKVSDKLFDFGRMIVICKTKKDT